MNFDLFDITGSVSVNKEHVEWSVEAMQEEISALEETHNNMDELEKDTVFYKACEAEMNIKSMAVMEAQNVEDASEIFAKYNLTDIFSQEAAKDVLAREAYRGVAKIKTLIAAIIKFVQEFITFGGTINKAYAKLKKLAKTIRDGLKKKAGSKKVQEDKFVKEITNLSKDDLAKIAGRGLKKNFSGQDPVDVVLNRMATGNLSNTKTVTNQFNNNENNILTLYYISKEFLTATQANSGLPSAAGGLTEFPNDNVTTASDNLKDIIEEFEDLSKDNKEEFEKNQLLTRAIENASTVFNHSETAARNRDLKQLEKFKKTLSKLTSENVIRNYMGTDANGNVNQSNGSITHTIFLNIVQLANTCMGMMINHYKKHNKIIISLFDRMLTECKAVEAMAA